MQNQRAEVHTEEGLFDMVRDGTEMKENKCSEINQFLSLSPPVLTASLHLCVCVSQDEDVAADHPSRTTLMAHPVAERLDTLMAVMMAYIKDICHVNGR